MLQDILVVLNGATVVFLIKRISPIAKSHRVGESVGFFFGDVCGRDVELQVRGSLSSKTATLYCSDRGE